jgi:predicted metalloprotease with PDZ domain
MIRYFLSIDQPQQQYVHIQVEFEVNEEATIVRLPSWRPGRYELGNFAKNVKGFTVFDDRNKRISANKISKDGWLIDTSTTASIRVMYSYYAAELNAGSTYLSAEQLYVNPVNCFVFIDQHKEQAIEVQLRIPASWQIAAPLPLKENCVLLADSFDELADSPFICSPQLQHQEYVAGNTLFHIWVNGTIAVDWDRMLNDFKRFSEKQIEKFTEFPVNEYHFLIHILPYKAYHGVEHTRSTVITLGPSHDVFGTLYKELLGVSSHELYHTWNVKMIRPIDMFPYDFTKENYSRMGYLCEGVTTYMGDLFLLKSGVFTLDQYLNELNTQLQKHFDNHGRFNYSVAESSFDTWLDGYVPGAPGRKVSIYTEGCLLSFVMDTMLLRHSGNKYGLDEVMKRLYFSYALNHSGVSERNFLDELKNASGFDFESFFDHYVHGTDPYESIVSEALDFLGLELFHQPVPSYAAGRLGFKYQPGQRGAQVFSIYPGSPADLGGLMLNDEIIAVNGYLCNADCDNWLNLVDNDLKVLTIARAGKLKEIQLPEVNRFFYAKYSVLKLEQPNTHQKKAFEAWIS